VKTILISGASIAGPALAWWLHRFGFASTIVEKAPGRARGGHAIDVRGAALHVLRGMGLEESPREKRTRMKGVSKLDEQGNEIWRSEEMTISGGSFGKDAIEILRDDLSNVLVSGLPREVEIIFGDSIAGLDQDGDGVVATFAKGAPRRIDLVVGADGLRSNVRNLVFGPDGEFLRPFDVALAPHSAPNILGLEDWQLSYEDGGDSCMIYTTPGNRELRVCFGFDIKLDEVPPGRAEQIAMVRQRCAHMGWQVPRLLELMAQARDFYLGPIAQVKMPHWTQGRVALVGDAGYCPSPFTGQGTSLAIVGGYVLARELARSPDDHSSAFARYEARMRPFVEVNQAIADLTIDPRFKEDPGYYQAVIEPALDKAEYAIELEGLEPVREPVP
jgi:2-polyprenyl-6-methoxyphenol hydroxylase-like FAD-dependent oxidoreductase